MLIQPGALLVTGQAWGDSSLLKPPAANTNVHLVDCSPPGSLSMRFSREKYWSGLPFPSPGKLSRPGIKPVSPALAGIFFTIDPPGKYKI